MYALVSGWRLGTTSMMLGASRRPNGIAKVRLDVFSAWRIERVADRRASTPSRREAHLPNLPRQSPLAPSVGLTVPTINFTSRSC
jgi:hypothetical protein